MFFAVGETQWPTTAAPITSEMNSYFFPFQANSVGQELPRRSSSVMARELFVRHLCFVLRNSGGPQHPHHVGVFRAANAGKKLLRSLAQIAGGSGDLELLPDAIGKDLYLGADRRFVVGDALHRNQHRVISVAALVVQEQWDRHLAG